MTLLQQCSECGGSFALLLHLPTCWLCADCWRAAGCPSQPPAPPDHEREERIRQRMTARGGADRHLVRAGRA